MRMIFWFATVLVAGAGFTGVQAALQTSEQDPTQPMVEALAQFRFDELGHPQIQSDSIKPVLAPIERPHKLLVLPVRLADKGYDRFAGDPAQDDKNRAYFQDLLFAGGPADPEPGTLSHYYWHQSPRSLQHHRRYFPGGGARAAPSLLRPAGAKLRW